MSFAVASYNVLADSYIRPDRYRNTPEAVLDSEWRHPALLRHVVELAADVVCLQEVEPDLFRALADHLRPLDHEAHLALKRGKPDGCATFVRTRALTVRAAKVLHYADGRGVGRDSGHLAQILLLEQQGRFVGVANTHLKWDAPGTPVAEQRGHRQITQLLEELPRIAPQCRSWIICGDFNVTSDSAVVQALETAGFVDAYRDRSHLATCNPNRRAKRIDYLFHTIDLTAQPADLPVIDDRTPLPSLEQPSDHLAILAWFEGSQSGPPPQLG